jgi:hypothetical protein
MTSTTTSGTSTTSASTALEHFMHTQVACWNQGDKDGFFAAYAAVAPAGIHIEYVGGPTGAGQPILEGMWAQQQPKIDIEEVLLVVIGSEAVAHNRNKVKGTAMAIETIEHYRLTPAGELQVRYFIRQPAA